MIKDDRSMRDGDTSRVPAARWAVAGALAAKSDANVLSRKFAAQTLLESAPCLVENHRQVSSPFAVSLASGADGATFDNPETIRGNRQFGDGSRAKAVRRPEGGTRRRDVPGGPWPLACLLLLLSACAQQPPAKPKPSGPPINLSGYSPAFRQGFDEGCETARGNKRRDEQRYTQDAQYARGWDDGRAICAKR